MKIHTHLYRCFAVTILTVVMTACSSLGLHKEEYSGATVIAVNYSGHELSYIAVEDPKNPGNAGGGDALNPYSGGGHICCFGIPDKWRPDLQVIVEYKIWPEKEYRRVLTNVPPYSNNKPGDIWIMVHEDDSVEAVVSNAGPSHPDWPGKIKDWPTPSREYRLKVWERKLREEKDALVRFEKAVKKPDISNEKREGYQETLNQIKKNIQYMEANKP